MIELRPYMVGFLKSLDKDYDVENLKFELTDEGYRLIFTSDTEEPEEVKGESKVARGEWQRDVEIIVKLGKPRFEAWGYSKWSDGFCNCRNCCEEERPGTKTE